MRSRSCCTVLEKQTTELESNELILERPPTEGLISGAHVDQLGLVTQIGFAGLCFKSPDDLLMATFELCMPHLSSQC